MKVAALFVWSSVVIALPHSVQASQKKLPPNSLPVRAEQLKSQGLDRADPETIMPMYRALNDFEEVTASAELTVLARCDSFLYRMHHSLKSIETLYKFHIEEILFGGLSNLELLRPSPEWSVPNGLQPLAPVRSNDILVARGGGSLTVNGVLFRESIHGFPPFEIGGRYVLFLNRTLTEKRLDDDYQGRPDLPLYTPVAGPFGCVAIEHDPNRGRHGVRSMATPFEESLKVRFQGQLEPFLRFTRQKAAKRPLR